MDFALFALDFAGQFVRDKRNNSGLRQHSERADGSRTAFRATTRKLSHRPTTISQDGSQICRIAPVKSASRKLAFCSVLVWATFRHCLSDGRRPVSDGMRYAPND